MRNSLYSSILFVIVILSPTVAQGWVSIAYLRKMSIDYQDLPNIQWKKKYSGTLINGSGIIHELQFNEAKNTSKLVIRYTEQSSDVPGGLSKAFHVDCSFDRCIFRYFITLELSGPYVALNHKRGDSISFNGTIRNMDHSFWKSQRYWMRDFKIYCDGT
jgi:hypothetical protein